MLIPGGLGKVFELFSAFIKVVQREVTAYLQISGCREQICIHFSIGFATDYELSGALPLLFGIS